jgi:hypothetical protein
VSAATSGPAPLPAPSTSTSTAALANGTFQPLDPNHDLRIGKGGDTRPTANASGNGVWRDPAAPADVTLRRPEVASETPPAPRSGPQPAGTRVASFEQAQALLRTRNVVWQRLETASDAGDWKFSCAIANRQNPNLRQTYEASSPDQLAAIQAVLDKIDGDQR